MSITTVQATDQASPPSNEELAAALVEVAERLEEQGANEFRVRAYRAAAETLRSLKGAAHRILQVEGVAGLMRLPGIGRSLGHALEQLIRTRQLSLLDRLRGQHEPERIFATVPDIGPKMARRIHEHLGIETLAELQAAANDGRLAEVPGMGRKRIRAVRESIEGRYKRGRRKAEPSPPAEVSRSVPVEELLELDDEYRRLAKQHKLPRIAPQRFNPTGDAWLPVWHPEKNGRHYTVLYSNTARAHELGTTHDWVVIYRDDDSDHGRWTVITSNFGRLRGRRIVRGREDECAEHYAVRRGSSDPAQTSDRRSPLF
jgi:hypothetical protein